ncbi:hypothetical protein [uncultured Chryseobacterium sp.]|uniref:hypothetical protein n=1 Tax=uncultured Chryseobacterium sp. TaxID=259322 RepID=UPI0025D7DC97|nr:hypothetical protein [uncultured Chryseobacterium sp.]
MQSYWHNNRDFPPAHPDWRKKADLVNGKVPAGQLPSYVDDVLEFNAYTDLPKPGEKGKIYITTTDNKQFRWGGSAYIEISSDENVMTLSTEQSVSGRKYFVTSNGSDILNQKLWLRSFDGSNPAAVYYKDGYGSGALGFDGDEFRLTNIGTSAYAYLNTKGIKKDNSNDDYVLTGGGGHIVKKDLGISHTHQSLFSEDTGNTDANSLLKDYKLIFNQRVERGSTNMFPMIDNANAVLSIASHPGGYGGQLGFNDNEQVFFRGVSAGNYGTWKQFAFRDWVDNNYLSLKGGTLSGDLTLKVLKSDTLNGNQIVNAGNQNQLYFGNPVVDTVYHESGNNHIFSNKGNRSFTIDSNGNVTAKNAVNAGNDSEIGGRIFGKRTVIDTLGLDESKYYPVTIQCNTQYPSTIKVYRTLDASMGVPSYSSHGGGFWCYYEFQVYGNGWGTNPLKATCNYEDESWVNDNIKVIGYDHMGRSSNVVIYLRGGSKYWFDVNSTSVPTLHTSPFTVYDETVEPTKSRIWSGSILMNANTNDIQKAISGLNFNSENYIKKNERIRINVPNGTVDSDPHFNLVASNLNNTSLRAIVPSTNTAELFVSNNDDYGTLSLQSAGGKVKINNYIAWHGGNLNPLTLNTNQTITGLKAFVTGGGNYAPFNNALQIYSDDGSLPAMTYSKGGSYVGQIMFNSDGFHIKDGDNNNYYQIKSKGFIKNGSDDNYVLLGGGHHKLLSELGTTHTHQFLYSSGNGIIDANTILENERFNFIHQISYGSSNMFPMVNNANAILNISSHPGGYGTQLGFNDNEQFFFRGVSAGNYNTWKELWHSGNFNPGSKVDATDGAVSLGFGGGGLPTALPFVKHSNGTITDIARADSVIAAWENAQAIGFNSCLSSAGVYVYHKKDGYIQIADKNWVSNNYFNKKPIDYTGYTGASYDLDVLSETGFYNIGHGTVNDASTYFNNSGARALLHFQAENPWTATQIQTHRYQGNLISRSKSDGGWSHWVRHWGDNDFTAADVAKWNNSISKSSASEEVILEDDTLKIQPDEFSLEGSESYDFGSRKKLVHVLFREGKELNIREMIKRQTIVVFNFSKDAIIVNIEGLKPYPISPGMQVTLYISDEREVLLYNETDFKKLQ